MTKKLPYTPNSQIKSALRRLFLRSRERNNALKRDENRCQGCGAKASVAKGREVKVQVHHREPIENWGEMYGVIREYLLIDESGMITLCESCHKEGEK